jgi:hypothetical protein
VHDEEGENRQYQQHPDQADQAPENVSEHQPLQKNLCKQVLIEQATTYFDL